jgi:hypothetical protein
MAAYKFLKILFAVERSGLMDATWALYSEDKVEIMTV